MLHQPYSVDLNPIKPAWPVRYARCSAMRDDLISAQRKYLPMMAGTYSWPAQVYQESLCDPMAVSPVGARGSAQIMPDTWREISSDLNLPPGYTPHSKIALDAGAYYQARKMAFWFYDRPWIEKYRLGAASYNAGPGNILKAQKLSGGKRYWRDISPFLLAVTGNNAHETITYVDRIERWWTDMCGDEPFCQPEDF